MFANLDCRLSLPTQLKTHIIASPHISRNCFRTAKRLTLISRALSLRSETSREDFYFHSLTPFVHAHEFWSALFNLDMDFIALLCRRSILLLKLKLIKNIILCDFEYY